MAILIDPPAWPAHGTFWSHLVSDADYDELHEFAARLGTPRRGFDLDHYDVPAAMHGRAVELGALPVSAKDIVHRLRSSGLRVRKAEREAMRPVRRRQYLVAEWSTLGASLGVTAPADPESAHAGDWLRIGEDLVVRWNEPHRCYHDERHLEDVLLALDHMGVRGEQVSPATLLAAWFHDAVYEGVGGSDEERSARLAVNALRGLGLEPALVQSVGELIVATVPGGGIGQSVSEAAHLLDADLSIFAASPKRYEQYAMAVRTEYARVPAADFAAERARILSGYLARPAIYRTAVAQQLWEEPARVNVAREIERLTRSGA